MALIYSDNSSAGATLRSRLYGCNAIATVGVLASITACACGIFAYNRYRERQSIEGLRADGWVVMRHGPSWYPNVLPNIMGITEVGVRADARFFRDDDRTKDGGYLRQLSDLRSLSVIHIYVDTDDQPTLARYEGRANKLFSEMPVEMEHSVLWNVRRELPSVRIQVHAFSEWTH